LLVTVPHAEPVQPVPARDHVTAVLVAFVTVAVNCCVPPISSVTLVGEIATATGGATVTVAVADLVVSATEVAVTVTCAGVGTLAGAV